MNFQKKLIAGAACCFIMLVMNVGQTFAGTVCNNAKVTAASVTPWLPAGGTTSKYQVMIQDATCTGGANRTYYIIADEAAKSYYATALTALALNKQVILYVSNTRENSLISFIKLTDTPNQ